MTVFIGDISPYFRTARQPLKPFQLDAVVVRMDSFGSRSLSSHRDDLERADRSAMMSSLILKAAWPTAW